MCSSYCIDEVGTVCALTIPHLFIYFSAILRLSLSPEINGPVCFRRLYSSESYF